MAIERIVSDPAIMAGAPTVRGTRVTVSAILGQLGAGLTADELLEHFPSLTREDIAGALAFAAASLPAERPFAAA